MVIGLGVIFPVVDGVAHLVFMAGEDEFWIDAAGHAFDVGGPAVGEEHVDGVLEADVVDPGEVGPVVVVVPFDDEEEAIAIANGTEFGLYDYVFSQDSDRAYKIARQLRSGNVGINSAQRNHEAPFGGFKMSGVGRDGGDFGMLCYTEMQSIIWPG